MADWNEPDLRRRLCSAARFNDRAMALGLRLVNTLFSSVSASLSSVTRRDQRVLRCALPPRELVRRCDDRFFAAPLRGVFFAFAIARLVQHSPHSTLVERHAGAKRSSPPCARQASG